jgi:hypothetical protein
MIEITCSPRLESLSASLDDAWESEMVEKLPFPIAFHLEHLRRENYPWDFLLKDMLHILLKYLAIVATSDYLHSRNEPDFDINEQLQNLRINMSEGHWLRLLRTCSASGNGLMTGELKEIFNTVEKGPCYAKITWPETSIKSDNAGILSTLVTIRNKLLGHGKSPSEQDKQILKPQILGLLRAALYLYEPVWKYDLVYVFERQKNPQAFVLRGTKDFVLSEVPGESFPSKCFLAQQDKVAVSLFPLVLSDKPKLASQITLINLQSEQYILEHIDTHFKPEYVGVSGASYKSEGSELNHLLENKRVWTKRQDIELEEILDKLREKTLENLEDIEYNNIYKTGSYYHRKEPEAFLHAFIEDQKSRALIVSGVSGCGKTTSIMHFVHSLIDAGKNVLLTRAIELPERVQKPKELEKWILEYLGYKGTFAEILEYARTSSAGKLIIIIDGLNEFTAIGRDASKIFNNINHFLADYQQSDVLKVIISFRSDTLAYFLPGGRLPVDAVEEVYFRPGERDYYEIGTLSTAEGLELLGILKVPAEKARGIMNSLQDQLRTPQVIYKIASGAISPEDLKGMDSLKITGRFLEKRLGRDKELKKLCMDLVGVMGKAKDMNLTEEQLAGKSPKLLTKLKANNNYYLNVLSDLEIIQQIKTEDKAGNLSSAILMAHDTIFEALSIAVEKSTNKLKQKVVFPIIFFYIIGIILLNIYDSDREERINIMNSQTEQNIQKFDSLFYLQYISVPDQPISDAEKDKISSAYHALIKCYQTSKFEYSDLYDRITKLWPYAGVVIFFLLLFPLINIDRFIKNKLDKREIRIRFFGKNEMLNQLKHSLKLSLFFFLPILILVVITSSFDFTEKQFFFLFIVFMTMIFLFALIQPFFIASKTIQKSRESTMIREYFLSKFGRHLIKLQFFVILGILILSLPLGIITMTIPTRKFISDEAENQMRKSVAIGLSAIDLEIIESHQVPFNTKIMEFARTRGESLDSRYGLSQLEMLELAVPIATEKLLGKEMNLTKAQIVIIQLIFFLGMLFIGFLTGILPYEIAARKYYRSS